jgi:hypothetical protein
MESVADARPSTTKDGVVLGTIIVVARLRSYACPSGIDRASARLTRGVDLLTVARIHCCDTLQTSQVENSLSRSAYFGSNTVAIPS